MKFWLQATDCLQEPVSLSTSHGRSA